MKKLSRRSILLATFSTLTGTPGATQDLSTKPIRLVSGFPPGGGVDAVARIVAQGLSQQLSQPVIIDIRPGAGGAIALAELQKATPDGYTFGYGNVGQLAILEHISKQQKVDVFKSIVGVGYVAHAPMALFVPASLGVNSLADYLNLLKNNPDKFSYGSGGNGQIGHLAFEMLKSKTNVKIQHIPYKGLSPALTDLIAGRLVGVMDVLGAGMPHVKSGKLRVLALAVSERVSDFSNIPTFKELGVADYVVSGWQGMVAPVNTPPLLLQRMNQALSQVLSTKDIQERLIALGYYPQIMTSTQFSQFMQNESARWGALCRELKIEVE